MKVIVNIHSNITEDKTTIEAKKLTSEISNLIHYAENLSTGMEKLKVKKGKAIYLLEWNDIYTIYLENRILQVRTREVDYQSSLRLYSITEKMPSYFLQISQSEIINLHYLDHLCLTPKGSVKIILKNNYETYSSRRYLKAIKEALEL